MMRSSTAGLCLVKYESSRPLLSSFLTIPTQPIQSAARESEEKNGKKRMGAGHQIASACTLRCIRGNVKGSRGPRGRCTIASLSHAPP